MIVGWVGPKFVLGRRAGQRLQEIDDALPGMIDLLVVTLEAGVAFTGALRSRPSGSTGRSARRSA